VVLSDFWSPIEEIRTLLTTLSASGAHGMLVQVVDPAEEAFPYAGRIDFVEPEAGTIVSAGRAETWAKDYDARLKLHRDQIRAETAHLGWSFAIHSTDRSAAELLLVLHGNLSANRDGAFGMGRGA
jgi:uncharacterized protein (DUF58 family)